MKKKILTLLLLCSPILLGAQNYEQQGDELFAQAQYEKAEKKYKAAIEMSGTSPSLQSKKEKCSQCARLYKQAISAEETASGISDYEKASKLYSDLYAIHALLTYRNKADTLKRKADKIRQENAVIAAQAERAERERQAKIEAERKAKLEVERKAKLEAERKAKEQKEAREREAKLQQERQRKAQDRAAKDQRERAEAYPVLSKILKNPLGVQTINWTDSKNSQKKAIIEKYPRLSVSNNYKVSGRISGLKYYYDISSVLIDLNYGDGNEIWVSYGISMPSPDKAYSVGTNIYNDLKKFGFRMSSYNSVNGESSCNIPYTTNGIKYNWIRMSYSGSDIIIKFSVSRKSSNQNEGVVHNNSSSSSNTSYTHSTTRINPSSSSSNGRGVPSGTNLLGEYPTGTEMYVNSIKVDITKLPDKTLKLKLTEKDEPFPITYVLQVGVKKVKCQRFEFTGEIISSAVPNEVEGKRSGNFMVFPIRATCKISKNYAPELRNCIWIESK